MTLRHSWAAPVRLAYETRRACAREGCAIVKVTRHEPGVRAWQEFWRGTPERLAWKIEGAATPACEGEGKSGQDARGPSEASPLGPRASCPHSAGESVEA